MNIFTSKKFLLFAGGVVAGLVIPPAAKSKSARKAAVSLVAKGLAANDTLRKGVAQIHEEAADVYAEAKAVSEQKDEAKTTGE